MKRKTKIGIILALVLTAIVVVVGVFTNNGTNQSETKVEKNYGISYIEDLYNKLQETENYSFNTILNEENYKKISRNKDSAKIEIEDEGTAQTYIVKNENTYLLTEKNKKYYEYNNNTSILNDLENKVKDLLKNKFNEGTENINGKDYTYQEFEKTSSFLINFKKNYDNYNAKTRFYFADGNLHYIRTYVGEVQQLLKVELEFNNQKEGYKIPSDYTK
ncbi:MAG: hypothetical protein J5881_04860 [Clostridia bacterium]|nr:hypothetical protein [Clostridia bacterium]